MHGRGHRYIDMEDGSMAENGDVRIGRTKAGDKAVLVASCVTHHAKVFETFPSVQYFQPAHTMLFRSEALSATPQNITSFLTR